MGIQVGIWGAAGYAGREAIRLIENHPEMSIRYAISDTYAGERYNGVRFVAQQEADMSTVDLVLLCTPHTASAPLAKQALAAGAKVVDLSADLRLHSPEAFETWYGVAHPVPELLPTVYGLPEFYRADIPGQTRIANPGCYPTTSLLAILPLAEAGGIQPERPMIIDAKSGVSGAGRKPKLDTHFAEVFGDLKPYNIGRVHRHVGEMEQTLQAIFPQAGALIFTPHLLPIDRGLLAACYIPLADEWDSTRARAVYTERYADEPFVTVLPEGETARIAHVARQNGAVVSLHAATDDTLIVLSALDNLLKGASSQALQNANLMFDLPETYGLR
ncbi:MAG: N-acetyl-gamma-glutamyl-phosphate reductase [Anaerolineales bacterium]